MAIHIRKGCNRYTNAHCYLVQPTDFALVPNFLEGNQVGGAVNQFALSPIESGSMAQQIMEGSLSLEFPDGTTQTHTGVPNETTGLDFPIDPVIPINTENQGDWKCTFSIKFKTVSGYDCPMQAFVKNIEIGQTEEEEIIEEEV